MFAFWASCRQLRNAFGSRKRTFVPSTDTSSDFPTRVLDHVLQNSRVQHAKRHGTNRPIATLEPAVVLDAPATTIFGQAHAGSIWIVIASAKAEIPPDSTKLVRTVPLLPKVVSILKSIGLKRVRAKLQPQSIKAPSITILPSG